MVILGINLKKYTYYLIGLYFSIFLSIFSTIIKTIFIKNIINEGFGGGDDDDEYNYSKNQFKENNYLILLVQITLLIFIFYMMDWILTIVLICYRSKVRNFCSDNIQNVNLNNLIYQNNYNNTQNFNNNNNFVQTSIPINQNINAPVQPYIPNLNTNIQPNV